MKRTDSKQPRSALIDLSVLESHLWKAANSLRGPVDTANVKFYIIPLLFFKRLSDVYDEELDDALEESDGDMMFALLPDNHRFQVPEDSHWEDVRAKNANIGHALQQAMNGIERDNLDTLHGIFGDAQWTNKDRLSDHMLRELIEYLGFARVAATDEVLQRGGNLSISLYVRAENGSANGSGDGVSLRQFIAEWQQSSEALRESISDLFEILEQR